MRRALARTLLSAAASALPADAAYRLAGHLSGVALAGAAERLERATLAAFPDRDARWAARAAREQLRHRAWIALDKRMLPGVPGPELLARCEGLGPLRDALDEALGAGRGAVLYSIHYGRPLVMPAVLAHAGYPHTLVRAAREGGVDPQVARGVERADVETIFVGTESTSDETVRALERNRVLYLLADSPLARQTAAADFLGGRLPVAVGVAGLARHTGAALLAATTRSSAPFRFRVDAERVSVPGEGATPEETAAALLAPFEATVRDDPGPWYGANRVFRAPS
jgi:lauroyl/myristoyl acyltransferase